jgi:hypothetical protein
MYVRTQLLLVSFRHITVVYGSVHSRIKPNLFTLLQALILYYTESTCKIFTWEITHATCFRVSFVSSQGFSKSGKPDVLKLFHRHSVWMIRISVLVKVNCILVKVIGIQHYSFIDIARNHG